MIARNGKLWTFLSLGLVGSSAIAAGAYFVVSLFIDKSDKPNYTNLGKGVQRDSTPIAELENLTIDEHDSLVPGLNYLLSDSDKQDSQIFKYLKEYLIQRLGFGPEIGLLKGIHLMGITRPWGANANGLYIADTNEIFINTKNILQPFIQTGAIGSAEGVVKTAVDPDTLYKAIAEAIFEVIFHEYGHHMAYCYLNNSYRKDPDYDKNTVVLTSMDDERKLNSTTWDKNFLDTFKSTLGYDGSKPTNYKGIAYSSLINKNTSYNFPTNDKSGAAPYPIYSLNSQVSVDQLWNYSNDANNQGAQDAVEAAFKSYDKMRPFGKDSYFLKNNHGGFPWVLAEVPQSEVSYYYSQDELFTRKFMQATMRFSDEIDPKNGLIKLGNVLGINNVMSTTLEDTLMYSDNINPHPDYIFNPDYLFTNKVTNTNGNIIVNSQVDNSNAETIYQAFLDRTGYNTGDDISEIYYQNNAELTGFDGDPVTKSEPSFTSRLRFGGYISKNVLTSLGIDKTDASKDNDDLYIGYYDSNHKFIGVKTFTSDFNIKVKNTLVDEFGKIDSPSNDTIEYSIDDYVNGDTWKDHPLYFASRDFKNTIPLKTVNKKASTDASRWQKAGSPFIDFQKNIFHPIVDNKGNVELEKVNN